MLLEWLQQERIKAWRLRDPLCHVVALGECTIEYANGAKQYRPESTQKHM